MEPPSSINNDQNITAGVPADDPLSNFFTDDSYFVVTSYPDEEQESLYVVCGYSPLTGLSYIGTARTSIES